MPVDNDTIIIILAALCAAVSFAAFALPFLNQTEKKERFKAVIEKKRQDLFAQAKAQAGPRSNTEGVSGRESVAAFFKVQQMLGDMGEKTRNQLLQAGIRSPSAPIKFMMAKIGIPIFLVLMAMMIIKGSEKDLSGGLTMTILMGAAFVGYKIPGLLVTNQAQKREQEISLSFPDALDMMLICVQGGIGLEQAVQKIAEEVSEHSEVLAEELGILSAEMAMLNDRRAALQDFARRVGSGSARSFATAMIQAEQYGTSVSQAMRVMADESREMRMAKAEETAASLPPKLTVPMIAFFLPVLFVVILGPSILQFMSQ